MENVWSAPLVRNDLTVPKKRVVSLSYGVDDDFSGPDSPFIFHSITGFHSGGINGGTIRFDPSEPSVYRVLLTAGDAGTVSIERAVAQGMPPLCKPQGDVRMVPAGTLGEIPSPF